MQLLKSKQFPLGWKLALPFYLVFSALISLATFTLSLFLLLVLFSFSVVDFSAIDFFIFIETLVVLILLSMVLVIDLASIGWQMLFGIDVFPFDFGLPLGANFGYADETEFMAHWIGLHPGLVTFLFTLSAFSSTFLLFFIFFAFYMDKLVQLALTRIFGPSHTFPSKPEKSLGIAGIFCIIFLYITLNVSWCLISFVAKIIRSLFA